MEFFGLPSLEGVLTPDVNQMVFWIAAAVMSATLLWGIWYVACRRLARWRTQWDDQIAVRTLQFAEQKQRRRQAELIVAQHIEDPELRRRTLEKLVAKKLR